MKKSIELLSLDSSALKWLKGSLHSVPDVSVAYDILHALEDLYSGRIDGLLLEFKNVKGNTSTEEKTITCGVLSIYPRKRKVTRKGVEITLTPKEFDILYFLARNRGEVFTKEQIYQAVWDRNYLMDDNNIMAFIRKLRKKIEPDPDAPEYILTIWGVGYKFSDQTDLPS